MLHPVPPLQHAIMPASGLAGSAVMAARFGKFSSALGLALKRRRSTRSSVEPATDEARCFKNLGGAIGTLRSSLSSVTPDVFEIWLERALGVMRGSMTEPVATATNRPKVATEARMETVFIWFAICWIGGLFRLSLLLTPVPTKPRDFSGNICAA
jgi:hypothetical protein